MKKKFFNYVIPAVIGMLVAALYIIVDGMFVGKGVGSSALDFLISMPVQFLKDIKTK